MNANLSKNFKSYIKSNELCTYNEKLWKQKFPYKTDLNYEKLQLTNIGLYSIATPIISDSLINLLQYLTDLYKLGNNKDIVITEANGGIGGFSIKLVQNFNNINIVEIDKTHIDIIKNNISVYNPKHNVKFYNNDYLDIMFNLTQDIIIFDVPWNGRNYKFKKNIKLELNNINIWHIINELYIKNKFKICILMTPFNFDVQNFIQNIISKNIIITKMEKHYFISIILKS